MRGPRKDPDFDFARCGRCWDFFWAGQRRVKRELAQSRDRAELGALVGAAESRLAAMAGGGDRWPRRVVEGRLQAARAQWSVTRQAEVDYSQRLLRAASVAGVTVEEGALV